eukprot:gene4958-6733_t
MWTIVGIRRGATNTAPRYPSAPTVPPTAMMMRARLSDDGSAGPASRPFSRKSRTVSRPDISELHVPRRMMRQGAEALLKTRRERRATMRQAQNPGHSANKLRGRQMTRLVGFYPGSFDPLTNGHLDVIERACKIVDTLVVAVGVNPSKKPLFSHADRIELLRQTLEPVGERTATEFKIVEFTGLMVNAARANGAKLIIRGLRDTTDYNFEMQMVGMNAQMAPE